MNNIENNDVNDDLEYIDLSDEMLNSEENITEAPIASKKFHIFFGIILALIVVIIVYKLWNWGTIVKSDFDPNNIQGGDDYIEVLDSIVPHIPPEGTEIIDDGVTTIVCFGNGPFADDKGKDNNLANIIAEKTGAIVYNCSITGSYATNSTKSLQKVHPPMDAFTFYWLTTLFCVDNQVLYDNELQAFEPDSPEYLECKNTIDTINSIDFSTVDVITIMYDSTDFYMGNLEYDGVKYKNIQSFSGNIYAGIELIQKTYPHIRIIVLSPTFTYSLDDNGDYVDSELNYKYIPLSSYAMILERVSYLLGVTFVDNFYGSVNANNASDYLENHYQLNDHGRELIAERFIYALNYFE